MPFLSPGVNNRELDLSLYIQLQATTKLGMVGLFAKGEFDKVISITSEPELTEKLGRPLPGHQGWYAAREFLRRGNQLEIIRIGNQNSASKASADLLSGATASLRITPKTKGSEYNGYRVITSAGSSIGIRIVIETEEGAFVDLWDNITRANANSEFNSPDFDIEVLTSGSPGEPDTSKTVLFSGGADGIIGLGDANIIGANLPSGKTGMKALSDAETIDINLLNAPGFTSPAVVNELLSIASTRSDTLALIDSPYGLNFQEVRAWHNGEGTFSASNVKLNSNYGALYWDWQPVFSEFEEKNIWLAPSAIAARVFAYNDAVSHPWFAPAGYKRGRIRGLQAGGNFPDKDQRDFIQQDGQNVNPFANFSDIGPVIWGQKTLQRQNTALNRVNVRRMLLFLQKIISSSSRSILFDQIDGVTFREWKSLTEPVFKNVLVNRGVRDYKIVMDSTTTTELDAENNRIKGRMFIKPTKSGENLQLDYVITPQGADFTELANTIT